MSVQSKEEMKRVFIKWAEEYAPKNLANTDNNAKLLAGHCVDVYGFVSIANLNASSADLTGQLELVPTKSAEHIQKEWDERERKRIEAERLANSKPFNAEERAKAAEAVKEHAKRQE